MKKLFLGSLAFAAMALTSCSEENEALLNNTLEVFTGEIVTSESRTFLGSDNSVLWSGDDAINLFKQTGYYQKYKVKQGGSATASFVYDNVNVKGNTLDQHYAVYPYAETNSIQGTTISVDLSSLANQTYTANSFEEEKAVMVAKSATTNLSFKNALSVIRVNLNIGGPVIDATVSSIKITSADKALTGMATVDMSQEMQPAVVAADGGKVITLTAPNVALGEEMTPFYIMFPAGNYAENELTVEVTAVINGESKVCEFPLPAVEIKRSMITTLEKTFDDDEEWTGSTEGEGEGDNISFVSNEEALQSVLEEGGIVKLANDIVTTESLSISEDVTIDLNGYDLDVDANGFVVAEGKKLTIIDSKAGSTMSARAASVGTTITGTGDIIKASAYSEITIGEGVNLITTGTNSCCVWIPNGAENVTLNTEGNLTATASGAAVISHNGYLKTGNINIIGGNITHDSDVAVYIAGNANVTVSGNAVITGTTAMEVRAGKLTVNGGKFVATASPSNYAPNGNGTTSTGVALAMCKHSTTENNLEVEINGGEFTGVKSLLVNTDLGPVSVKVKGGTFSDPTALNYLGEGANVTVELADDYEGAGFATADGQTVVLNLNNKTYTATDPLVGSTGTKSQAFQFLKGSNVTIKNGTLTSSQARMFVQNYTDLTLENVTLSPSIPAQTTSSYYYVLSNNGGDVKINNGTKIIAPKSATMQVYAMDVCNYHSSYPNLTVTVAEGAEIDGNIEYTGSANHKLVVNGGTFTGKFVVPENYQTIAKNGGISIFGGTFSDASAFEYLTDGASVKIGADMTIADYIEFRDINVTIDLNGKKIVHPANSSAQYKDVFEVYGNAELTIEGSGSVIAEDGYSVYAAGNSKVNLNGGYYFSPVSSVYASKNAVVTINGGEFYVDGTNNSDGDYGQKYTLNLKDNTAAQIIVKGGKFYKFDPANNVAEGANTDFVADGYTSAQEGDYYVVSK